MISVSAAVPQWESETEIMNQTSSDASPTNVDAMFRALAARSRRRILATLLETTDRTVEFEPLAERLAAPGRGAALGVVTLKLLHRDLPSLEAVGLVKYDAQSETITATERTATIEPLLAAAQRFEHTLNNES